MEDTKADIAILFERVEQMDRRITADINEIKTNHIVHLTADIKELSSQVSKLRDQIKYWAGGISVLVFIIGVVLALIRLKGW